MTLAWHPRLAALRRELDGHRAALRAAVDAAPAASRDTRPGIDRWSIAEVIEHLARTRSGIAALVRRSVASARAAGTREEAAVDPPVEVLEAGPVLDRTRTLVAPDGVRPTEALSFEAAWTALEAADDKLEAALMSGNGLALGSIIHPHPALGPIDLYQWIAFAGLHEVRHAAQVLEIAAALASARTSL